MDIVNIYTYTGATGPRRQNAAFTYVIETDTVKGPATLSKTEYEEDITENQAELRVLLAALHRLRRPCMVNIYTDSWYVAAGYEKKWGERWKENGWKNAKGEPAANREEWQEMAELLGTHVFQFFVGVKHSYYAWMQAETQKRRESYV